MKKITFKVNSKKDTNVSSIIKKINEISCRIFIDMENGVVIAENVNNSMIDTVIELVDNYYTILGVDIDNTFEKLTEEQESTDYSKTTVEAVAKTVDEEKVEEQAKTMGIQSENDLIIKKVEFENQYVEGIINKLLRTVAWAIFKQKVSEKEIGNFIYTAINEISMKYNKKNCIEFSVGDIVNCNYGTHLPGEINGGYVHGIVCNISNDDMAYIVPVTKATKDELISHSYLEFNSPIDVLYRNDYYKSGIALLDKGKYINVARLNSVIGKTMPEFFNKLLKKLAHTFDFTDYSEINMENQDDLLEEIPKIIFDETDDITSKVKNESVETVKEASNDKKIGEEAALLEIFGTALNKLNKDIPASEQVEDFMKEIGMPTNLSLLKQSFVIACDIKKISYEYVVIKLRESNSTMGICDIKEILKQNFKNWLTQYPELAEKYHNISLMSLLKVFAKKFA